MLVDLHCHTTASDGALSPTALLDRALANGVEMLAITDHDTMAAYELLPRPPGLELVTGIEFSCQWQNRGIHLVGLNVDPDSAAMAEAVERQRLAREERASLIGEKLEKYGLESPLAGARAEAANAVIGRPHFARHLVACGFVKNEQEAFKKYLGTGKTCDVRVCWPDPARVIEWIRGAGGVAVLAHPAKYNFTRRWLVRFLEDFRALGGQGMEVISGPQAAEQTRQFVGLAESFGLGMSLGSDFHSPDQHWLDLGRYGASPVGLKPVWDLWNR